jgi:hypothetical protein
MAEFGRTMGKLVKQRYMLSAMCGRSTYKLTWEEIVRLACVFTGGRSKVSRYIARLGFLRRSRV